MEDSARYVGRAAYLELDSGLHAKLQFVTQGFRTGTEALQQAPSAGRGEIDRVTVRLKMYGADRRHICGAAMGKAEWYGVSRHPGIWSCWRGRSKHSVHCMNRTPAGDVRNGILGGRRYTK